MEKIVSRQEALENIDRAWEEWQLIEPTRRAGVQHLQEVRGMLGNIHQGIRPSEKGEVIMLEDEEEKVFKKLHIQQEEWRIKYGVEIDYEGTSRTFFITMLSSEGKVQTGIHAIEGWVVEESVVKLPHVEKERRNIEEVKVNKKYL
jgi:hypothetical protein